MQLHDLQPLIARVALPAASGAEVSHMLTVAEVPIGLAGPGRAVHWLPVLPPVTLDNDVQYNAIPKSNTTHYHKQQRKQYSVILLGESVGADVGESDSPTCAYLK